MNPEFDPSTMKKLEKIRKWIDLPPETLTPGKRYRSSEHGCDVMLIGSQGCPEGWVEIQFKDEHTEMVPWTELRECF